MAANRGCAMRWPRCAIAYDLIIIDCPPSLNMLTVNALVAADSVLVPMQCEYYALEGLSALSATIEQIGEAVNPGPAYRRDPADHVRPAEQPLHRSQRPADASTSAIRCSAR